MAHSNPVTKQMSANPRQQFNKVFPQLEKLGLLLLSDSFFPNVYQLISGDSRKGSWWGAEEAHTIFAVNEMLEDHRDVLVMKLVSGKVTFVHREIWAQIYSIGVAREDWQMKKLSSAAKLLLEALDKEGTLQTNKLNKSFGPKPGDSVRELEQRLLVHAAQVHSESGAHTKVLQTWDRWAKEKEFRERPKDPEGARLFLDERVTIINESNRASGTLPWTGKVRNKNE